MVKKYYLAGGFTIDGAIAHAKPFFKRPNLVDVPPLLEYTYEEETLGGARIYFYVNSMSVCVFLAEYGDFSNDEEMWVDYRTENRIYNDLYSKIIGKITSKFSNRIDEVDWIMPVIIGEDIIDSNYISLSDIDFIIKKSDKYNSKCVLICSP